MIKRKIKIVCIIGEPLSGKREVSNFIIKKYGYTKLTYSDVLTGILKILNLALVRPNYANLAIALRERFGGSVLSQVLLAEAKKRKIFKVIFDGARHPAEVDCLRKTPGFVLIYVTASSSTRFKRAVKRGEKSNERTMSYEDFKKEGRLATEAEFKRMSRGAIKVLNEGSLQDLKNQLDEKLGKVIK